MPSGGQAGCRQGLQSPPGAVCAPGVRQGSWLPRPHQVWGFQQLRGPFVLYLLCLLGGSVQISIPFGAEIPAWLPILPPGSLGAASYTLSRLGTHPKCPVRPAPPAAHIPQDPSPACTPTPLAVEAHVPPCTQARTSLPQALFLLTVSHFEAPSPPPIHTPQGWGWEVRPGAPDLPVRA